MLKLVFVEFRGEARASDTTSGGVIAQRWKDNPLSFKGAMAPLLAFRGPDEDVVEVGMSSLKFG